MKTIENNQKKTQFNIEEFEDLQNQNKVLTHQVEELSIKLNWYEELSVILQAQRDLQAMSR